VRDIILPAHVSEKIVQHEFVFRACMGRSVIGVPSSAETVLSIFSADIRRYVPGTCSCFQPLFSRAADGWRFRPASRSGMDSSGAMPRR